MAETPEPADQSPLPMVPRRYAAPERPADSSSLERLAALADNVKVLANQLGGEAGDAADSTQERSPRRRQKFQRTSSLEDRRAEGDDSIQPESYPADTPGTGMVSTAEMGEAAESLPEQKSIDATARNRSVAWPRLTRDEAPVPARRMRRRRSTTIPLLVLMACNLGMLAFGYWIGQSAASGAAAQHEVVSVSPARTSTPAGTLGPPAISDLALDATNIALKAEKSGDGLTARRLYEDAIHQRIGLSGAEYRLAMLAINRRDLFDADLHLGHSTAAGEYVAQCHYIRATFAGARGNYGEAGQELEAAVHADPLNAKYYFCWGECLRRDGKPRAAASCLEQALDRPYGTEEGNLYLFKLGLAKVEFGRDDDFNALLTSRLEQPTVSGDWLLLAAAQDIQHENYRDAAAHLSQASRALPPTLFDSRVRDYFFQAQSARPELAAYMNRAPTPVIAEASASVMDPADWSPDKADPGTWPTAGAARR